MKIIKHPADSRGHANHGWLDSHHTFSFASYYNPERVRFGKLRVLNDDHVEGGMGFGTHPHENMEIISIPLEGALAHKDSMGNSGVIKTGDVQVMSAGTGVQHSEFNASQKEPVKFLQIWIFPRESNVEPRYDQKSIDINENEITPLVKPGPAQSGLWIHQDAWISRAKTTEEITLDYKLNGDQHGVYVFVLDGSAHIYDEVLRKRDGMGITDADHFTMDCAADSDILLLEVPV